MAMLGAIQDRVGRPIEAGLWRPWRHRLRLRLCYRSVRMDFDDTIPSEQFCPRCGLRPAGPRADCEFDGTRLAPVGAGHPLVGTVVARKYLLVRPLGAGNFGAVFLAQHMLMQEPVALKMLHERHQGERSARKLFIQEARALRRASSPHVVAVHEVDEDESGQLFIVMELLNGVSLAEYAKERANADGRLDPALARAIVLQVCDGLAAAHARGVVHRDLKPANVMVEDGPGGDPRVRVVDFGVARLGELSPVETTEAAGMVVGTPAYMSPEQCRGLAVDGRADLYGLGVMLYEMLSGERPFKASTGQQMMMAHISETPVPLTSAFPSLRVPPDLAETTTRLLQKTPDARPSSAEEVRGMLLPPSAGAEVRGLDTTGTGVAAPFSTSSPRLTWRRFAWLGFLVPVVAAGFAIVTRPGPPDGPAAVRVAPVSATPADEGNARPADAVGKLPPAAGVAPTGPAAGRVGTSDEPATGTARSGATAPVLGDPRSAAPPLSPRPGQPATAEPTPPSSPRPSSNPEPNRTTRAANRATDAPPPRGPTPSAAPSLDAPSPPNATTVRAADDASTRKQDAPPAPGSDGSGAETSPPARLPNGSVGAQPIAAPSAKPSEKSQRKSAHRASGEDDAFDELDRETGTGR
jgi:serine/threonine protein kinase